MNPEQLDADTIIERVCTNFVHAFRNNLSNHGSSDQASQTDDVQVYVDINGFH